MLFIAITLQERTAFYYNLGKQYLSCPWLLKTIQRFYLAFETKFSTFEIMDYSVTTWKDPIFRQVNSGISYQPNVLRIERELPTPSKSRKLFHVIS